MHSAFLYDPYLLRRQGLAWTGKTPMDDPCEPRGSVCGTGDVRLREDVQAYSDTSKSQEIPLSVRPIQLHQRFNPFRYQPDLDFGLGGPAQQLDRRSSICTGLLAIIEGKQKDRWFGDPYLLA